MLVYMVEHHDAVLDKERIMEAVWSDSIVEENNLAQAIWKLRQVFGETPGSHSYIVTVPGRGLSLCGRSAQGKREYRICSARGIYDNANVGSEAN